MAIHSHERKSDPRVVCGLLARGALEELSNRSQNASLEAILLNLKRVLEMYLYDAFSEHNKRGVLNRRATTPTVSQKRAHRGKTNAVYIALQEAHKAVFPTKNREEVVEIVGSVLEAAKEQNLDAIDPGQKRLVVSFLTELVSQLGN